jgi:N-acetylglucosamine-6-phosphate deacetylase
MLIKCDRILTEEGFVQGYLKTSGFSIDEIIVGRNSEETIDLDFSQHMILPGLVDIHLHGYRGRINPFKGFDLHEFRCFLNDLACEGTTACLPSIEPEYYHVIRDYRQHLNESIFLGLNLEAYFSCNQYVSFRQQYGDALELTLENGQRLIKESNQMLRYVMIAPELDHAKEVIAMFKEKGIRVSVGHTVMSASDFMKFHQDFGFDSMTHWGNNMGRFHQRDVGVIGVGLLDPHLKLELITDFVHLSKEMIEIALKMKTIQNCIFVSDSVFLSGLQPQTYTCNKDHTLTITLDRIIRDMNGDIQGCYQTLFQNMITLVRSGLLTIEEAVIGASLNPAKFINVDHLMGSIKKGKYANFIVIDEDYHLISSFVYGKLAVRK